MNKKHQCPPARVLGELIEGKMVDPELSEFSQHLEACSDCQQKVQTLFPSDTLIHSLRGDAPVAERIARDVPRHVD